MTNIYWPVFKNLEEEFEELMFNIHIDDEQLDVYSSKISDLILRASTEIESLSKELYKENGGPKKNLIRYDSDAIKYLNSIWNLNKKVVIVSSYKCFQSNRTLYPFEKTEVRKNSKKLTYGWNNAYQNLKHDRANSLSYGSIKYLFDVMSALYLLNLYYKNDQIELGDDSSGASFNQNLGSNIFSIKYFKKNTLMVNNEVKKEKEFLECTYLIQATNETLEPVLEAIEKMNSLHHDYLEKHLVNHLLKKMNTENSINISRKEMNQMAKKEKEKIDHKIFQKAYNESPFHIESLRFEAVLNKT